MIGSVEGHFSTVFGKLAKLQSKTPFSLAIVAGDLFAEPSSPSTEDEDAITSLLEGRLEPALPIYFGIGRHGFPERVTEHLERNNSELCQNLYFLAKRSTTKTSEGIRVVSLGGTLDANVTAGLSQDKYLPSHTEGDARSLHGANSADILITNSWPASITTGSKVSIGEGAQAPIEEQCVADLCAALKPRYHFSTSGESFYEREPFFHAPKEGASGDRPLTRFISLASSNTLSKAKWLYAFSLDPKAPTPSILPTGTTPSPLNVAQKRSRAEDQPETFSRYASNGSSHHSRPHKKRRNQPPPGPGECFFCLSNPNLSTHLITSIAADSYLTTAKGPLTLASTYPGLQMPCHILLIPLTHVPTLAAASDSAVQQSTFSELQLYRGALNAMLSRKAANKLGSVTWEVSRERGVHFHWQFLPVPIEMIQKGLVEAAFKVEAENENYPNFQRRDIGDGSGEGEYFRVWISAPEVAKSTKSGDQPAEIDESDDEADNTATGIAIPASETQLVLPIVADMRFDIQFGRRVMGKLLGLEKRLDWRDCVPGEEEEKQEADRFKEMFKPFDFSLDDE